MEVRDSSAMALSVLRDGSTDISCYSLYLRTPNSGSLNRGIGNSR